MKAVPRLKLMDMIIKEWEKIKSTFGDERRTTITIVK